MELQYDCAWFVMYPPRHYFYWSLVPWWNSISNDNDKDNWAKEKGEEENVSVMAVAAVAAATEVLVDIVSVNDNRFCVDT